MRQRPSEIGFTIIELVLVLAVFAVLSAMAVPALSAFGERMKLGQGQREVERELQMARLKAVTANRRMRVLFNCPSAGQYRRVEVLGSALDDAADRCSETKYPILPPDKNPLTRPNFDGSIRYLPLNVSFGAASGLEFAPDGTVMYQNSGVWIDVPDPDGTAVTLTKTNTTVVASISVNHLGKIQAVQLPY